ncbi:MAG: caspase family protein [Lentisphaeria bacterium]|nr:caspase family protein [Lentisphaeria bacterium]
MIFKFSFSGNENFPEDFYELSSYLELVKNEEVVDFSTVPNIKHAFLIYLLNNMDILKDESEHVQKIFEYCQLVSEGFFPSKLSMLDSPEACYLGLRHVYGKSLINDSKRFISKVEQLFQQLIDHLKEQKDLYSEVSLGANHFPKVHAFLDADKQVFLQDIESGDILTFLDSNQVKQYALCLHNPKSALYRYWSRHASQSQDIPFFQILISCKHDHDWIICSNPVHQINLKELAEALTKEEQKIGGDAWDEGFIYQHTLIAAPNGESKLSQEKILGIFSKHFSAKAFKESKSSSGQSIWAWAACLGIVGLLALLFMNGYGTKSSTSTGEIPSVDWGSLVKRRGSVQKHEVVSTTDWKKSSQMKGYAVLISVGQSSFGKLDAATQDIMTMYEMLTEVYGYEKENILILSDEPDIVDDEGGEDCLYPVINEGGMFSSGEYGLPTRENVMKALTKTGRKILDLKNDPETGEVPLTQFVFYYAGHGVVHNPSESQLSQDYGYLVLSDYWEHHKTAKDGEFVPENHGIDMQDIPALMKKLIPSSHQMIFLDCCHSGFALKTRGNPHENPDKIYAMWKKEAQVILAAASTEQYSQESQRLDNSFFTTAVKEALSFEGDTSPADVEPRDGIVTDSELGLYVKSRVADFVQKNRGHPQTPSYTYGASGEDIGQVLFIPLED